MKTYIFFPDTGSKAGLGHLNRCYKYSDFLNEKKTLFFIKNSFPKKYLNPKKKYLFYQNINFLKKNIMSDDKHFFIIDTYDFDTQKIFYKKYSKKLVAILDFESKFNFRHIIDHTLGRNKHFHQRDKRQKIYAGLKYFPIKKKIKLQKRNIILIDFGTVNKSSLIKKALSFLKHVDLDSKYKIIIINKYFSKKNIRNLPFKKNILIYNHKKNIAAVYKKTFFSIGACGISLYEKSFYGIPSIVVPVAKNQMYNYKNFFSINCILKFDKMFKLRKFFKLNNVIFLKKLKKIEYNLKKNFNNKINSSNVKQIFNAI